MGADEVGIVDPAVIDVLARLHLGLDLLDDVTFLDDVVLDLDAGDFLERLCQRLRFIFVHSQGFGDGVDLHSLEGGGGLDEPLHLLHLVFLGQGRRLEFAVDPLLGGSFVGKRRRSDRSRSCHQRDRARHHQDAGPDQGPLLFSKRRMLVPPLQRQTSSGPGWSRICSFSPAQTVRKIATAETSEITVASHRLDNSMPLPRSEASQSCRCRRSRSTADG